MGWRSARCRAAPTWARWSCASRAADGFSAGRRAPARGDGRHGRPRPADGPVARRACAPRDGLLLASRGGSAAADMARGGRGAHAARAACTARAAMRRGEALDKAARSRGRSRDGRSLACGMRRACWRTRCWRTKTHVAARVYALARRAARRARALAAGGGAAHDCVPFSSVDALLGGAAQASYFGGERMPTRSHHAAARAAWQASSVQWGAWAEVGMAAWRRRGALRRLEASSGLIGLSRGLGGAGLGGRRIEGRGGAGRAGARDVEPSAGRGCAEPPFVPPWCSAPSANRRAGGISGG